MSDMLAFQQPIVFYGKLNALSQTLLKLTSPSVPDIYQGFELWDLSLVDPDNRRPVDYVQRQQLLSALTYKENGSADQTRTLPELDYNADEGDIKLYMMSKALGLGSEQPELFANGHYEPLTAEGPHSNHVCAFFRHLHGSNAIVAVPRLVR